MTKSTALLTQHILSQIVDLIELPILLLDMQKESLPLVLANPRCQTLLQQWCGRADNLDLAELLDDQTPSPGPDHIVAELTSGAHVTLRLRPGHDEGMGALTLRLLPLHDKSGATTHALGLVADTASAPQPQPKKDSIDSSGPAESAVDRVTGLLLQPAFESRMAATWSEAANNKHSVGVMVFRIDDFDKYIETFGKQAANSARRLVGHAIGGSLRRADDLAARFDGDEFVGSISGAEAGNVTALAERIVSRVVALCIHHPRSEVTRYLSVSAGVALAAASDHGFGDALAQARRRMDAARDAGGNRVSAED